jgi:hypothetical protein
LGNVGDAAPGALVGLEPRDVLTVEQDLAGADRLMPDDCPQQRLLPTPLRPSTQVILPGSAVTETCRSACAAP